jgi:hypothetical protein
MKKAVTTVLALLLCPVCAVVGQQSGGLKISVQGQSAKEKKEQPAQPLTNDSIIKLVKAKLSEDTVISIVNTRPGEYSLGADDIIALKRAGVSDRIIAAIVNKAATTQAPAAAPLAPVAPAGVTERRDESGPPETKPVGQPPLQFNSRNCPACTTITGASFAPLWGKLFCFVAPAVG